MSIHGCIGTKSINRRKFTMNFTVN